MCLFWAEERVIRSFVLIVAALWATTLVLPSGVAAQTFAAGDVDLSSNFDEDRGHRYRFRGQLIGTAFSERVRVGGEFEIGKYETALAGLPPVQVKSYDVRGVLQVVAWPHRASPYFGVAFGVNTLRLDDDAVENLISSVKIDNFGIALGGVGFVGFQVPLARGAFLFSEGRVGAVFDVIDPASVEMGVGNLDGFSGVAGLRMRF